MSLFARSVFTLLVLMAFLWSPSNAGVPTKWKAKVGVKNSLGGNLDLNVYCPHIDPKQHILPIGDSYQWDYFGGIPSPGETPFLCYFRWQGGYHSFDMCVPDKDTGCEWATWEIKQAGYCRNFGIGPGSYVCGKWTN